MSDAVTDEAPQGDATPPPQTEEVTPPETPSAPTWVELIEKADPKELRSHPRIAGILGSETQRAVQADRQRREAEAKATQREATEGEMLKLFEDNADYVKQHYPKAYERFTEIQAERAGRELDGIRGKTAHELAENIGRAMHEVPEWAELTETDLETLARALVNKPDEEVIALFNRHALDLVAEKRAAKRMTEWRTKELAKEREAIRQEEAAKLLKKDEAPDTTKPKNTPAKVNVTQMTEEEFDKYWDQIKTRTQR